jgi:type IV pilus assembly protein PilM
MLQLPKKKKKDEALVGLEIEAGSIAAAEVRVNGDISLGTTAIAPLPAGAFEDGEVTNPAAITEALEQLFSQHHLSRRVRLGIANQRVVVRTLRLPAIEDPKELDTAVRFQAQEQIPMPLDQAVLDHRVVGGLPAADGGPAQIDVVVVAARRDMIAATLKPLLDAGLEPAGVDLSAFGLIRALGEPATALADQSGESPTAAPVLYCNIGDVTNLAIARRRSCLFTRVSPTGLDDIAAGLAAATGLSKDHAEMWLAHVGLARPVEAIEGDANVISQARLALERGASAVLDEIQLSLDFYGSQDEAVAVERVVLSGAGGAIPDLAEHMAPVLGLPVSVGTPEPLASIDAISAARLTVPYGLALES